MNTLKVINILVAIGFLALSHCSQPAAEQQSVLGAQGTVERLDRFPSKWVEARHVDIWLPKGYNPNEAYSVLYMHDGQMLFDSTSTWNKQEWGVDEVMSQLMAADKIHPCIVVGVWNNGTARYAEYFPQKPFESLRQTYRDSLLQAARRNQSSALFSTDIQSDHYLKFLTEELKPYIDQHYATLPDRAHTFIAGSSMGGLISMYALCEYPQVFGGAACLSTHWPGTFETENNPIPTAFCDYLSNQLPDPANHKLYFDYGTATLDSLYEPFQLQVDSVMREKGYDTSHWVTRKFEGEDHSERAWRKRLDVPLLFLLGKSK